MGIVEHENNQQQRDYAPVITLTLSAKNAARQRDIIVMGNELDAYCFAVGVKGADIKALQQVVMERGNVYDAYCFARDVSGADIQALQCVIMECSDADAVYHFAKGIPSADLPALRNRLVELHATDADAGYMDKFNADTDIQARLKAQLVAASQSKHGGTTSLQKRRPS